MSTYLSIAAPSESASALEFERAPKVTWSSVWAGCFVALSFHILLALLGLALGLAVATPQLNQGEVQSLPAVVGIAWTIAALVALWLGGWTAGRLARITTGNFGGWHGILVWGVATVATFGFFVAGSGMAVGAAARALGGGVAGAVQALGNSRMNTVLDGTGAPGLLESFVAEAAPAANVTDPAAKAKAHREVASGLWSTFVAKDPHGRATLISAVASARGIPPPEAEEMVHNWETAYARARDAAERATARTAKITALTASWTFVAFAAGAFFAAWGGRCGARRALALGDPSLAVSTRE